MPHSITPTGTSENRAELRHKILDVANHMFEARGFWASSLEDVCSEAGVDLEIVIGIYPNLYTLFRDFMIDGARTLLAATDVGAIEARDSRQTRACLQATIESLAAAYVARRRSGAGFLRGEHRYLDDDDRDLLHDIHSQIVARIATLITRARPTVSDDDAKFLAAAACSTLSSVITQATDMPEAKLRTMLTVSAMRLVESESALSAPTGTFRPKRAAGWRDTSTLKGRLVAASVDLLYRRGFSATIEDVALETGVPFETARNTLGSLAEVLSETFVIGTNSLRDGVRDAITAEGALPRDILIAMTHAFVEHAFTDPELGMVFLFDSHRLPAPHAERAATLYAEFMAVWLTCLRALRPELAESEATFLIAAGHQIVTDLGAQMDWQYDDETMARIERLVVASLIGGR